MSLLRPLDKKSRAQVGMDLTSHLAVPKAPVYPNILTRHQRHLCRFVCWEPEREMWEGGNHEIKMQRI